MPIARSTKRPMWRKFAFLPSAALGALLLLGFNPRESHGYGPLESECLGMCYPCNFPLMTLFSAISWPSGDGDYSHHHVECDVSTVCSCIESEEEEQLSYSFLTSEKTVLGRLAAFGTIPELSQAVQDYPERVLYNADRRAFQIVGCGGLLVAHIPVSPVFQINVATSD